MNLRPPMSTLFPYTTLFRSLAGNRHAQERGQPIVGLDREVQRILSALVAHLVNRLLARGQRFRQLLARRAYFSRRVLDPIGDVGLDTANSDHRLVRLVDLVADAAREVPLELEIGVAHG